MRMRPLFCLLLALPMLASRPLAVGDLWRVRTVSDPQLAPDGRWVAYSVQANDPVKDREETELWMACRDGDTRVRLAGPGGGEHAPRWSPDGRWIAFLASRGEERKSTQLWLLDRRGGEARRLTDLRGEVGEYAWSPDGTRLVATLTEPDPREDPEHLEGWQRKTPPPIVLDRLHFKQDRAGYQQKIRTHLVMVDATTGGATPLTQGPWDEGSPAWSPDGRSVAFLSNRAPDPDRTEATGLYVVAASPGAEPRLLGTCYAGEEGGSLAWSPDGAWLALPMSEPQEPLRLGAYRMHRLGLFPAQGGAPRLLTRDLDRPVSGPLRWTPDGTRILFTTEDDRAAWIGSAAFADGKVTPLTSGRGEAKAPTLDAKGGLAFLAGDSLHPLEVQVLEQGGPRRLSFENDGWLKDVDLGATEDFTCRSKDGTEVHGLVSRPPGWVPGRALPAVLVIHGGPVGQDAHDLADDYGCSFLRHLLAAQGYVVMAVNYRGSNGRGQAYTRAIAADWGHLEVEDLHAALDWAVAKGLADPARLGACGWSYGGILTDFLIASDTRLKAAVSGAGAGNQISMFGSDQYVVQYLDEMAPPWKSLDLWVKVSYPFFKADRIRTPTLFMGGEKDFNVPIIGSEQMYQALRIQGVETALVVYPGQYHVLTVPSYKVDKYQRHLAWFAQHLLKP